eukprot:363627-Chlamydomonas_euryale.AAC.3
MDGWMDGWMDAKMVWWVGGWVDDGWIHGWLVDEVGERDACGIQDGCLERHVPDAGWMPRKACTGFKMDALKGMYRIPDGCLERHVSDSR